MMNESKGSRRLASVYEWVEALLFALTVVLLVFTFVVKSYIVDGSSMDPTLYTGQRVFALSLFYKPEGGDIVIIDDNNNLDEPLVKRVIATEGQTVDFDPQNGQILVDGKPFADPVPVSQDNLRGDMLYPLTVPEGYIFVMGDNRAWSLDSRYSELGLVDERAVLGRLIG